MENENIEARESMIHNKGVFAKKDIPADTRIAEYTGEKITKEESERRLQNTGFVYIMWLNEEFDIDGDTEENIAKYSNHSCDPNCKMEIEDDRVWLISTRDIKEGEEITWDYEHRWDDFEDKEDIRCNCGSENCRRYMARREDSERIDEYLKKKEEEEKAIKDQPQAAVSSA